MKSIISIMASMPKSDNTFNGVTGWIHLAKLGIECSRNGLEIKEKLETHIRNNYSDDIELYDDNSYVPKVVYARLKVPVREQNTSSVLSKLKDWAYLGNINDMLIKLVEMNLLDGDKWVYPNGLPNYPNYPILFNLLQCTFCRLQYQGKVAYSIDGRYAAFNTGLVNKKYMSIVALFSKNDEGFKSQWIFKDFIIPGQREGKILNQKFKDEIEPASFYDDPSELIYNLKLGSPMIDYEHILAQRVYRLPEKFLEQIFSPTIDVHSCFKSIGEERRQRFEALTEYLRAHDSVYRNMKNRFDDAVEIAMKRTCWNYKTAVPMYYPRFNSIGLLLPLALADEAKIDIALIVNRTPADKYEGVSVLSLDQAYTDARVIARPNSEWLNVDTIEGSNEIFG
ncbi:MAG: DUF3825 domain-containing protein [Paludibacteraceae bacterium]|nr:DUF3825 domain-containing protein [Paludibacteraceae bacterium]